MVLDFSSLIRIALAKNYDADIFIYRSLWLHLSVYDKWERFQETAGKQASFIVFRKSSNFPSHDH